MAFPGSPDHISEHSVENLYQGALKGKPPKSSKYLHKL